MDLSEVRQGRAKGREGYSRVKGRVRLGTLEGREVKWEDREGWVKGGWKG